MTTMNISLSEALRSFVEGQIGGRGYSSSSEYARELIRKDRDRQRRRGLLLEGAASQTAATADADYFDRLRSRVPKPMAGERQAGRSSRTGAAQHRLGGRALPGRGWTGGGAGLHRRTGRCLPPNQRPTGGRLTPLRARAGHSRPALPELPEVSALGIDQWLRIRRAPQGAIRHEANSIDFEQKVP